MASPRQFPVPNSHPLLLLARTDSPEAHMDMGQTQSTVLSAVALAVGVGFAVRYAPKVFGGAAGPQPAQPAAISAPILEAPPASKKKKGKAKAPAQTESDTPLPEPKPAAATLSVSAIPGSFEASKTDIESETEPATGSKKKNKKKKKAAAASAATSPAASQTLPPKAQAPKPEAALAKPADAPPALLVPQAPSDSGDAASDSASQSGALSTTSEGSSSQRPTPAAGFSWGDYEDAHDVEDDDEGWGVVQSRGRRNQNANIVPATANKPAHHADEAQTKKQRQNAAKREKEKAAKALAEKERLASLAKHKREIEKSRMAEQTTSRSAMSGGMKASVDSNGKLVWE
ncbi:hypothetical protein CYLTODRAFT_495186 [Cylindrobasidium torrendii FP15055 ss-10]|uniref:Uncharacterized protein n=1 Tax=Cylindrobasidium torrendii FP15055 ss-10 TaxID=1314674 RepID=A0A0D7AUQ8_9AGAR|nr:hypothetical protein CYLTODRAFT_495186 [Cylindrobasidium torrendii FP15055 ss-10]